MSIIEAYSKNFTIFIAVEAINFTNSSNFKFKMFIIKNSSKFNINYLFINSFFF